MLTSFYVLWCSLLRHPSIYQVEMSDRFLFLLVRDETCLLRFLTILPHSLDGSICRKKNSPLKALGLFFMDFIFEKKMQVAIGLCCRTETDVSCKGVSEAHSRGKIMPIVHISASVHTSFL